MQNVYLEIMRICRGICCYSFSLSLSNDISKTAQKLAVTFKDGKFFKVIFQGFFPPTYIIC